MRTAAAAAILLISFIPGAVATDARPIDFLPPAQVGPTWTTAAEWVLLIFDGNSSASGIMDTGPGQYERYRQQGVVLESGLAGGVLSEWIPSGTGAVGIGALQGALETRSGWSALYIEAAEVNVAATSTSATISRRNSGSLLDSYVAESVERVRPARFDDLRPAGEILIETGDLPGAIPFRVEASDLSAVEMHALNFQCGPSEYCPDGEDRQVIGHETGSSSMEAQVLDFHHYSVESGHLTLEGVAALVLNGGSSMDATIDGWARLPLANCGDCGIHQETLAVEGRIVLNRLQTDSEGRFSAEMAGSFSSARADELILDPQLLGMTPATIAVATASALAILKFLLVPLFTRLTKEQALEHPRRKQIFDYIHLHPGANFREVARNTGIAAGTVRHHLNVLERSGQVVEHSHGSTVRLFENHGKFDQNWSDLVLLREPALGKLHDWLKAHPNSPQKAVLEAMEAERWSRSTTQHRLSRLVDGGIATIRLQGRLKMYSIVEKPAAARPPGLSAPTGAVSA